MINVFYEPFPETVRAGGEEYRIITDFREWLRFSDMLGDDSLSNEEKGCMMSLWFLDPVSEVMQEHVDALIEFYRLDALQYHPNTDDEDTEKTAVKKPPVLDWRIDAAYIIGDFRHYYNIDLLHIDYLHWWEFRFLLAALPDNSGIQKRISYRSTDLSKVRDKEKRRMIQQIQRNIAIPFEYDDEMIADVFG